MRRLGRPAGRRPAPRRARRAPRRRGRPGAGARRGRFGCQRLPVPGRVRPMPRRRRRPRPAAAPRPAPARRPAGRRRSAGRTATIARRRAGGRRGRACGAWPGVATADWPRGTGTSPWSLLASTSPSSTVSRLCSCVGADHELGAADRQGHVGGVDIDLLRAAAERLHRPEGEVEQRGLLHVQRHVGKLERGLLVEAEDLVVDQHERGTAEAAGTDRGGLAQRLTELGRAPSGVALVLYRDLAFERLDAADRLLAALGQGCPRSAKNQQTGQESPR